MLYAYTRYIPLPIVYKYVCIYFKTILTVYVEILRNYMHYKCYIVNTIHIILWHLNLVHSKNFNTYILLKSLPFQIFQVKHFLNIYKLSTIESSYEQIISKVKIKHNSNVKMNWKCIQAHFIAMTNCV